MFNAVIESYDKEAHGVVVGATIGDCEYRAPILNFLSEGEARRFARQLRSIAHSKTVQMQIEGWAKQYSANRHKLVVDYDMRVRDGEIKAIDLKRRRISNQNGISDDGE